VRTSSNESCLFLEGFWPWTYSVGREATPSGDTERRRERKGRSAMAAG